MLRSKEAGVALHSSGNNPIWPPLIDLDDSPKKRIAITYRPPTAELLAYVDFSVTTSGTLVGIKVKMSLLKRPTLCSILFSLTLSVALVGTQGWITIAKSLDQFFCSF